MMIMADIYYQLIKAEKRTIKQVPIPDRAATQALLDADTKE